LIQIVLNGDFGGSQVKVAGSVCSFCMLWFGKYGVYAFIAVCQVAERLGISKLLKTMS
jgi:hypothetical protein